jgi:hypothetical protein
MSTWWADSTLRQTTDIDIDALVVPFSAPEFWRKALVEDADEASE